MSRPRLAAAGRHGWKGAATEGGRGGSGQSAGWRLGGDRGGSFPVVEQRAPASGCRDHASRLRDVMDGKAQQRKEAAVGPGRRPAGGSAVIEEAAFRWSSSERQRADVETTPRGCGTSWMERRSNGRRPRWVRAVGRLAAR